MLQCILDIDRPASADWDPQIFMGIVAISLEDSGSY